MVKGRPQVAIRRSLKRLAANAIGCTVASLGWRDAQLVDVATGVPIPGIPRVPKYPAPTSASKRRQ
ncbi:MAG: hypothetical protein WC052_00980 [Patescibacteria group bacterium]